MVQWHVPCTLRRPGKCSIVGQHVSSLLRGSQEPPVPTLWTTFSVLAYQVSEHVCLPGIVSITGSNVHTGQKLNVDNLGKLRQTLLNIKTEVPSENTWRIACLRKFLSERYGMKSKCQDTEQVQSLIDSICTS